MEPTPEPSPGTALIIRTIRPTTPAGTTPLPPAFGGPRGDSAEEARELLRRAIESWLAKSMSSHTHRAYRRDLAQFMSFLGIPAGHYEELLRTLPDHVAAWRDALAQSGKADLTITRKVTALRSLFTYLGNYGFKGANPAHPDFVKTPAHPCEGKTVGLGARDCRKLLDAPTADTPVGLRDRALLAVLAFSACRVEELTKIKVGHLKTDGEHRIVELQGKGKKQRKGALPPEVLERLAAWLAVAGIRDDRDGPLFRPVKTPRGLGRDGFKRKPLTTRAVEYLVERYVKAEGLDPAVCVHSFRVAATTRARQQGVDILDLQNWLGHEDPRTTRNYIRDGEKLHRSPAYVLRY
jgi:integrase/recombinase XerD